MAAKAAKGQGGRPPKSDEGALTRTLAFRLRPSLHEKLQKAAALEGRSLSEEVEARIARSFVEEEIQAQRFGRPEVAFAANVFASAASLIEATSGKSFVNDPYTHKAVGHAFEEMMKGIESLLEGVQSEEVLPMQRRFDHTVMRICREILTSAAAARPLATVTGR